MNVPIEVLNVLGIHAIGIEEACKRLSVHTKQNWQELMDEILEESKQRYDEMPPEHLEAIAINMLERSRRIIK